MRKVSTFDLLLKQHGRVLIPLSELCETYLGVTYRVARRHYLSGKLMIPVVPMGKGQKAKLMIHIEDLAKFVDSARR
ncbi:pyocin activator PrtN family protein [Vibrio hannami]|uniref:pyocin activator PrtN family protein n=1 Tax=Vibrio hannami TaxID=2717094 RepID=UPI00240F1C1C|nr:pyocin activator PrtN family protein [Vibrio hannami]MDG3084721.1 pyocin activator PrtN family protein [Vibrio hannami]